MVLLNEVEFLGIRFNLECKLCKFSVMVLLLIIMMLGC